jgi:hypothetical protein
VLSSVTTADTNDGSGAKGLARRERRGERVACEERVEAVYAVPSRTRTRAAAARTGEHGAPGRRRATRRPGVYWVAQPPGTDTATL